MSRFVEFTLPNGRPFLLSSDVRVDAIRGTSDGAVIENGCRELHVTESPAEVVAKLQGEPPQVPASEWGRIAATESEAVQLLERIEKWWDEPTGTSAESHMIPFEFAILPDLRALLAKLKGGAKWIGLM